jgi:uncharacterized protein (TIGR03437 family)
MTSVAPSFFTLDGWYITATHADNTPVTLSRPAQPGEIIVFFGTGFGPTIPATPAGRIVSDVHPLDPSNALSVWIDGFGAQVAFAGISGAGLYQFNLTVPDWLPDGDASVVAMINIAQTQDGVFLPVHR